MTRKVVQDRRARNLELGKQDAEARCLHCRYPLPKSAPSRFCSIDCLTEHTAVLAQMLRARKERR